MKKLLKEIRRSLTEQADETVRESTKHFFKETDIQTARFYGLKSAAVGKIAKEYFAAVKDKSKEEVFAICEHLWQSGYGEEIGIACDWIYRFHNDFKAGDFAVFESWIERYVTNWATCDTFCNHTMGTFLEMYPKKIAKLKGWAKSPNPWLRRAAAVSLIIPARKGLFHKEIFEIATILLLDDEDLIQKGYGWMLKAASEFDQDAVFQFVMKNKTTMPRTALRYAIEKMPKHLKEQAMAKNVKAAVPHLPKRYAWVDDYCRSLPGCVGEYKREWDVTLYMLNGKWFLLIMQNPAKESILTLKLEPGYGRQLRAKYKDVTPGYHMNKRHWNSISLESDFSAPLLEELIDEAYEIVLSSLSKKAQAAIRK